MLLKAEEWIVDPETRLFVLIDQQEPRIAAIFRRAVAELKAEIDIKELAELLSQGRIADALDRLAYIAQVLSNATNVAFITAGQSTAEFLTGAAIGRVVFDQTNLSAVAAMQRSRLDKIREFTDEQRRATSRAIISGVETGTNPIAQARNFRDSIGLTTKQWQYVANYRDALERVAFDADAKANALGRKLRNLSNDEQIKRAFKNSKPLKPEQIDKMVERYTDRYIKHRAKAIARTEALRAVHEGSEEAYEQAIAAGNITADRLERTWRTRRDGRERQTHHTLAGTKKKWGEHWETVNGIIRYPGDPNAPAIETIQCRCAILTRIKQR